MVQNNAYFEIERAAIVGAIHRDFGKPKVETELTEVYVLRSKIKHAIRHLSQWTDYKKVPTPTSLLGISGYVKAEPKGCVLIIAPWNFPVLLALGPLSSAIAAGNTVMLKPSESTVHSSRVINQILRKVFTEDEVYVAEGGVDVSQFLLSRKWDHIFFTGGTKVGQIVMESASKHLTPVTLELGGKNPTIVHEDAHLKNAAERIVWGKYLNGGQACVAPDYIYVHQKVYAKFTELLLKEVRKMYPDSGDSDLACMVHQRHYEQMKSHLNEALEQGAELLIGGECNDERRSVSPTVIAKANPTSSIMNEEIFGPILPVTSYEDLDHLLEELQNEEKPLSFYFFSKSKRTMKKVIQQSRAGSTGLNVTTVQFNHPALPFGGVGQSGIGKGHGHWGFREFSNERSIVKQNLRWNALMLVKPPYSKFVELVSRITMRWL